ncbi:hypothetical protein GF356_01370 [candidate division GN15 bacterium]|nr:hypothetical protein [candidate division GN15 bacterium]
MPYIIIGVIIVAVVAFWALRKSRYYGKIFNQSHYHEVASWVVEVLNIHPVEESSLDDRTAIVSSGGIALAYTSSIDDGNRSIHFSISQAGGYTTGAVGGRFIFLIFQLLNKNKCEANVFKTQSTVHHVVFQMAEGENWVCGDIDEAVSEMDNYQPLPISNVNLAEQGG